MNRKHSVVPWVAVGGALLLSGPVLAEESSWTGAGQAFRQAGTAIGQAGKQVGQAVGQAAKDTAPAVKEAGKEVGQAGKKVGQDVGQAGKEFGQGVSGREGGDHRDGGHGKEKDGRGEGAEGREERGRAEGAEGHEERGRAEGHEGHREHEGPGSKGSARGERGPEGKGEPRLPPETYRKQRDPWAKRPGAYHHGKPERTRPAELQEDLDQKRQAHLSEAKKRWGDDKLKEPQVRHELDKHAWRVARLERVEALAEKEPDAEKKARLLSRAGELKQKEQARHERAMERLTGVAAAPSASAVVAPAASAQVKP